METTSQVNPWTASAAMPTLSVDDLERAVHFYEVLGFQEKWRFPDPRPEGGAFDRSGRWSHSCLQMGGVCFLVAQAEAEEAPIAPQSVYVFLRGVGDYYAHLRLLLGEELVAISDKEYGMRDFSLTDPWGHVLTFGEALPQIEDA